MLAAFIPLLSAAQTIQQPAVLGLEAYSKSHIDVFSFITNQAALARLNHSGIGIYGERRYLIPELNFYQAVAAVSTPSGNFAFKSGYNGFSEFNQSSLALAYGRKMGTKMDIGLQFNYQAFRVNNYGNAAAIGYEAGFIFHFSEQLHSGFHIMNPTGGKFGNGAEKLSAAYAMGWGYEASEKLFLAVEIFKQEKLPVNVNAAIQYQWVPGIETRFGVNTSTSSWWAGVGTRWKKLAVNFAVSHHSYLGLSPSIFFIFDLHNKPE